MIDFCFFVSLTQRRVLVISDVDPGPDSMELLLFTVSDLQIQFTLTSKTRLQMGKRQIF